MVDVGCVWEVSWRWGQTATYWPKVLLTIAALFVSLQGCSTMGHWGLVALSLQADSPAGILSATATGIELTQAVSGTRLYFCLMPACFLWAYASAPNSTTSTGQGDIPISSTGCTCFAVLPLIYTGASFDWRLGRGSICYKCTHFDWQKSFNRGGHLFLNNWKFLCLQHMKLCRWACLL